MPIRKLREMGNSESPSAGVTLPKDGLQQDGVVDSTGAVEEDKYVKIEREGDGEYRVTLVDA